MTELDAALVRRKLAIISRNLDDLAVIEGLSLEEFRTDRFRLKGVERLLQETVEAAVRASDTVSSPYRTATISAIRMAVPASYHSTAASASSDRRSRFRSSETSETLAP